MMVSEGNLPNRDLLLHACNRTAFRRTVFRDKTCIGRIRMFSDVNISALGDEIGFQRYGTGKG